MAFYLYIRENKYWNIENIYKISITKNIAESHSQYIKNELEAGSFIIIFEIYELDMNFFDNNFKDFFIKYNYFINAGKEFYYKNIIPNIIKYLYQKGIKYRMLSNDEIETNQSFSIIY